MKSAIKRVLFRAMVSACLPVVIIVWGFAFTVEFGRNVVVSWLDAAREVNRELNFTEMVRDLFAAFKKGGKI